MSTTTASTGAAKFVVPYVASMDASGAADYVFVQQETVAIAGIDYEFDAILTVERAAALCNAFTVSGKGVDESLNVVLSDAAGLQAVLTSVINGANEAENASSSKTATTQLEYDLHQGLLAAINSDNLLNTVQDVDFINVDVTIDSSGGAADMTDNLSDERCRLIYTQIPFGLRYQDASENSEISALPLLGGDVITFVFDVDLSDVVPAKSQVDINTSADPAGVTTGQEAGNYISGIHFNLASKRIAFNIAMPGDAGAELTGLKA
jgi:hypothetical protein